MTASLRQDAQNEINPMDIHVGNRLRVRRIQLGLTQEKLAGLLGLTFQQVQKYEHGTNRVSASRLYEIAIVLKVPITYFYENLAGETPAFEGMGESAQEPIEGQDELSASNLTSRETIELVKAYYRVTDPKKRKRILDLIRSMTDEA